MELRKPETVREFEDLLRGVGFTQREARWIASKGFLTYAQRKQHGSNPPPDVERILDVLRRQPPGVG